MRYMLYTFVFFSPLSSKQVIIPRSTLRYLDHIHAMNECIMNKNNGNSKRYLEAFK